MINTTENVFKRDVPKGTVERVAVDDVDLKVVNTTSVYDDAEALDENDIAHIIPAQGWAGVYEDGSREPLVVWVVYEDLSARGVALTDGRLDLEQDAESKEGFIRYERIDNG